ncbi:helix-turn-helix domain-containing protein [Streptomyces sp. NPDC018031]|uniref:helix-turn-helix domain-containing protein n=1 Tax=Streptomyces sp. NPDC018031 TaxID=3365033 RepID=UPI0037AF6980
MSRRRGTGVRLAFGAELRRLRQEAGMTLQQLAHVVHYSKGYLCKIERGDKRPPMALVLRCDALFAAEGALRCLVEPEGEVAEPGGGGPAMARRDAIATGVGSLFGMGLPGGGDQVPGVALPALAVFRDQLHHMRLLGQSTDPALLLPVLATHTRTVAEFASRAADSTRAGLLTLASRFAEYTGWMAQEAGDDVAAMRWTADAVTLAQAGGDEHLADYALVRRALVTFYNGAAAETIALAQQAQKSALPPRIRGLAAQREAQGHALAGAETACLRGLDRARDLLLRAQGTTTEAPVLGTTHLADPASMVTGWCLYDLGRPREAAEILDQECRRIAPQALRTRTRYGFRRALAHASSGEIEHSCELARELLPCLDLVPSATVRADVRRLERELSRFRAHRAVSDLQPALLRALSAS